jgi:glutaminyl-peptide cyclotransferase
MGSVSRGSVRSFYCRSVQLISRWSVRGAFGWSVQQVRGAGATAALVSAMIACTGAESDRTMSPAPTNDGRVARTSDSAIASTSNSEIAPPSESAIAPTGDSAIAPASDSAIAPPGEAQTPPKLQFDSNRAWEHLRKQVSFGPRPSGTPAIAETRRYIVDQLKGLGIESREQMFIGNTPLGEVSMANVIATIPGKRRDRLALASHFDTKLYREFRFVGANDGASSTAALLELARVLKARQNEFTIELLFLDGEEARMPEWRGLDNTYGSRHYVEAARKSNSLSSLKALVLLDMIGDRDLKIRRDSNSTPWLVDIVWGVAAKLGHTATFSSEVTTVEDDHVPFLRAGVPAVDVIDLENPTWHTPQDTVDFVSARSLQTVGDVIVAAIPEIEKRLAAAR